MAKVPTESGEKSTSFRPMSAGYTEAKCVRLSGRIGAIKSECLTCIKHGFFPLSQDGKQS